MKKEFTIFIIGLLLGAIISTGSIFIYSTFVNTNNNSNQSMQMPNDNQGMQNGANTPPDMPNSNNTTTQAS